MGLEFVDDGRLLVIVEVDGDVKLWDVDDATLIGHLMVGTGTTRSVMPWYDDETRIDPSDWVERACAFVGRELTDGEWDEFVPGDASQTPACP